MPEQDTSNQAEARHAKIVFKFWLKKAILNKRATEFRQGYETLADLIARINQHLKQVEKGTKDYR